MAESQMKRATLHDVAELAGVSYQTVSRVVNHHPNVSSKTRERVLRAIRQLDYRPNQAAKVLATGRSHMLQLITFDLSYSDPLPGMLYWARKFGYSLVISEIAPRTPRDEAREILEDLAARMIDGLVLFTPFLDFTYEEIVDICHHLPFVIVGTELGLKVPSVVFDQRHGTRLAIQHLWNLGHRQIAEVSGPLLHVDARMRHENFVSTLQAHGLDSSLSVEGDFEAPGGYAGVIHLLDTHRPFTALFVGNDRMAMGALNALSARGLRVPEDVSIVGFDDMLEAVYFNPPLTTVRQDFNTLGQQSIEYLVSMIKDPGMPLQQRVLYPELVVRNSTRPVA